MRRSLTMLILLVLIAPACQTMSEVSPEVHVANARSVYIASVTTMTELARANLIDLKVAEQFEAARVRAAGILEAADLAVANGADFNFANLTATVDSLQSLLMIALGGIQEGD